MPLNKETKQNRKYYTTVCLTAKMLGWKEVAATEMNVLPVLMVTEEFINVCRLFTITNRYTS